MMDATNDRTKKILIIGGGVAGLATGCYGRLQGYETQILEMYGLPGGLCTSWERKGYVVDGCIHWLMGTRPGTSFYPLWQEIGALDGLSFLQHKLIYRVEGPSGEGVDLPADVDQLEHALIAFSPEDEGVIRELIQAVRAMMKVEMPMDKAPDLYNLKDLIKLMFQMGPSMKTMGSLQKTRTGDFLARLKNPVLRDGLPSLLSPEYSLFIFVMMLATYCKGDAGWPLGGSLAFSRNLERQYRKLGGLIRYHARVTQILVEQGVAKGVLLADGSRIEADFVVSAADGHSTIYDWLKGQYRNKRIDALYHDVPLAATTVQVSLGLSCELTDEPEALSICLEQPFKVGGVDNSLFCIRHYRYDPTMSPPGCSVLIGYLNTDYDYWEKLRKDKPAYQAEKERIADEFVRLVSKRFPSATGRIDMVDVATPCTYVRYTGTWKGVYMSWLASPRYARLSVPGRLPGLRHFYMAGQWANAGGGVPVGVMTARWTLQRIRKDDLKLTAHGK